MQEFVYKRVKEFVQRHRRTSRPLLVGVSGGGDSMSLLAALLQCDLPLHVAHVDHQWRESSTEEADRLATLVPLHRTVGTARTEEGARKERLAFFRKLVHQLDCEAVALAHHADDLAETTFKRVVEGARLDRLGIRPVQEMLGLTIWRPLLTLPKSALTAPSLVYDPTNLDPAYHRGLLRSRIFPQLEAELGRPIRHHLAHLGRLSAELDDYLEGRIGWTADAFGRWADLSKTHAVEIRHLLNISRTEQDLAIELIAARAANRQVGPYIIDRGHAFELSPSPTSWTVTSGGGQGWRALWEGRVSCLAPANIHLAPAPANACYPGNRPISRWWTMHKVPACLRDRVPVVWSEGRIVGEFLTGQPNPYIKYSGQVALQFTKTV